MQAKAESKDVKYKDGKGNAFTFQQVPVLVSQPGNTVNLLNDQN